MAFKNFSESNNDELKKFKESKLNDIGNSMKELQESVPKIDPSKLHENDIGNYMKELQKSVPTKEQVQKSVPTKEQVQKSVEKYTNDGQTSIISEFDTSKLHENDNSSFPKIDPSKLPINGNLMNTLMNDATNNSPNNNPQVRKDILISNIQTNLDSQIISSSANLLSYRETFPISSVLYEKISDNYIKDTDENSEERKKFNIKNILEKIEEKQKELKNNLENKKNIKEAKILDASKRLLDANIKKIETKEERQKTKDKQNWELFTMFIKSSYELMIKNFPTIGKHIIDNIGTFIKTIFNALITNWTNVFAGFFIVGCFIMLVTYLSSKNKSDNNKSSVKNSSTSNNIFAFSDFQLTIDNIFAEFNSFTKRMNDNAISVSETISSLTTDEIDDINRSELSTGRGADNLYHFNGKDLNKMESKNGIYIENSVYSIYKPIDIKNKNFNIKWKPEQEKENTKYVFDCSDESMKDHFNKDCTVIEHNLIVSDKDKICTYPI